MAVALCLWKKKRWGEGLEPSAGEKREFKYLEIKKKSAGAASPTRTKRSRKGRDDGSWNVWETLFRDHGCRPSSTGAYKRRPSSSTNNHKRQLKQKRREIPISLPFSSLCCLCVSFAKFFRIVSFLFSCFFVVVCVPHSRVIPDYLLLPPSTSKVKYRHILDILTRPCPAAHHQFTDFRL